VLGLSERLLEAAKNRDTGRNREVHQLDLGYLDSPLSKHYASRDRGVLAGDRAPDAPVRGAGGLPTRLFELFRGPHWTLLAYDGADTATVSGRCGLHIHAIAPSGDIRDTDGFVQAAYGLSSGDCVLVRPDGYVGAVFPAGEVSDIEQYLDVVGLFNPDSPILSR
jgi:hypothetical protein